MPPSAFRAAKSSSRSFHLHFHPFPVSSIGQNGSRSEQQRYGCSSPKATTARVSLLVAEDSQQEPRWIYDKLFYDEGLDVQSTGEVVLYPSGFLSDRLPIPSAFCRSTAAEEAADIIRYVLFSMVSIANYSHSMPRIIIDFEQIQAISLDSRAWHDRNPRLL